MASFFTNSLKKITTITTTTTTIQPLSIIPYKHHYHLLKPSLNPPNQPQTLTPSQINTLINSSYNPTTSKFTNLTSNFISSPSVLFTASHSLSKSYDTHFGIHSISSSFDLFRLSYELAHDQFNPSSHFCLRLPNLTLKVVIECVRLVLEHVFEGGFPTFVYKGRHTALRYLKRYVENPTWWFTVSFQRGGFVFDSRNVDRLCCVIEQRIDDGVFVGLIRKLFDCGVLRIELGSGFLGKGLPQECGLCAILINIYFNSFDKKLNKLRLRINQDSSTKLRVDDDEHVLSNVVLKPVKVYAVRYLDEILLITSGSKVLAIDLLNWVVKCLEVELELKVDRARTCIHSAVSEKIDFLGMELQAVSPSALRPPISEKALRARKKFLRQKQVRALELKNARERNRRKLGMKIFSHVFKKIKQSNGFKFDYQIENEVTEISRTWANDVVQEFLSSVEERSDWHRFLTAGDFLSLKRIRDQLPRELVNAYDKFQEEVDRHLNPTTIRKALEEEERREEVEEERKYSERTVEDLTKLCMKVWAPIQHVRRAVRLVGFTNNMGRPRPISVLFALEDADIIKWYAGIGIRWLEFFCCCRNFEMVKTIVTYHLRFSCLLTLAEKHESTKREAIRHYSKDLKVLDLDGNEQVYFPTEREVKRMGNGHFSDPKPVDGALTLTLIRLACDEPSYKCVAHFCNRNDTVMYRVCLLQNRLNIDPMDRDKWVPGMSAIHGSLNRKCFPLCADHISDLYMGRISLQDIDCTSFVDVD